MIRSLALVLVLAMSFGCDNNKQAAKADAQAPQETKEAAKVEEPAAAEPAEAKETEPTTAPATEENVSDALMNPALANEQAPDQYKVKFDTTKGTFEVEVYRDWAPQGADRFYNLVKIGFFNDIAFFRVLEGFVAQFGIHGNPKVMEKWREARIQDDAVKQSNARGTLVFATAGPNTRTTQLFINFGNNANLDQMGFSPFGKVVSGMEVVDSLYKEYGEGAPRGRGPDQGRIQREGNAYLKEMFPDLDFVKTATIVE
jgi:peptidyl-prolyl cis-trans isomerase A (cyclophilin A)